MAIHGRLKRLDRLLLILVDLLSTTQFLSQCDDSVERELCCLGRLPFGPRNIEVNRPGVRPRRGYFGRAADKCGEIPTACESIGGDGSLFIAAGYEVPAIADCRIGKNPSLNQLSAGKTAPVSVCP